MTLSREEASNQLRSTIDLFEPRAQRTYTPTRAVLAKSSGIYHWTPEGRRLYDFTSGVLVANLGHNPTAWVKRVTELLGWRDLDQANGAYLTAPPLTAYNAITGI